MLSNFCYSSNDIIEYMSNNDRNTALIVTIVLIVCTISLIALGSAVWQLIGPGVVGLLQAIGVNVRLATVDYNFAAPTTAVAITTTVATLPTSTTTVNTSSEAEASSSASSQYELPDGYTYNFTVPALPDTDVDVSDYGLESAILSDAQLAEAAAGGTEIPQVEMLLTIPKIDIKSSVFQGFGSESLLRKGFWIHPASGKIGKGEVIMLCHRRYFGPVDPRSCWNLDKLVKGDELTLQVGTSVLRYRVLGTSIYKGDDPSIYSTDNAGSYLKIVTCHPLYSNSERFVVLAVQL